MIEIQYECKVHEVRKFLPKGPTSGGGYRDADLVQIYTDPGGLRTLTLSSISLGRRRRG